MNQSILGGEILETFPIVLNHAGIFCPKPQVTLRVSYYGRHIIAKLILNGKRTTIVFSYGISGSCSHYIMSEPENPLSVVADLHNIIRCQSVLLGIVAKCSAIELAHTGSIGTKPQMPSVILVNRRNLIIG